MAQEERSARVSSAAIAASADKREYTRKERRQKKREKSAKHAPYNLRAPRLRSLLRGESDSKVDRKIVPTATRP